MSDAPGILSTSIEAANPEDFRRKAAAALLSPEAAALRLVELAEHNAIKLSAAYNPTALLSAMRGHADAVQAGDMRQAEAMLMMQATALQSLFVRFMEDAFSAREKPGYTDLCRLALKAQSQSRATLESLANMKAPRVVFANQANIAHGPQQVNNGTGEPHRARGIEERENQQTQQSGTAHELLPHTRAPSLEGEANPALEAVGAVHRPEDGRRQG
jgi:hypothetical protein